MKNGPIILKLGGSVITEKRSKKPLLKVANVERLAKEIAQGTRSPLILLHGAGSFGHPLAHKYKLSGRALSKEALIGVGRTTSAMRRLGDALADIFLDASLPVVPLQTSALVREEKGRLIFTNLPLIESILAKGGVPLLGGDGMIADGNRIEIVSADRLATELARHFGSREILFATDVDGVFKKFPPQKGELPISTFQRKELQKSAASQTSKKSATDVTGAMMGKLRALLPLKNCTVTIFNGFTPGTFTKVLRGKQVGTRIVL